MSAYPCIATVKLWRRYADAAGNIQNTTGGVIEQELIYDEEGMKAIARRAKEAAECTAVALLINGEPKIYYSMRPAEDSIVEEYTP